jgi:hypothetical protein
MTTPHRRRWMRDYMSNYRRHPEKNEALKKAHRFDSFLWRLSKCFGLQYYLLMCMEYGHLVLSNLEGVVNNDEFDKGDYKKDTEIF